MTPTAYLPDLSVSIAGRKLVGGQAEQTPPGTVFDLARGQSGINPVD